MQSSQYIHDPERVLGYLKELPDERIVARKALKLQIPARFAERNLATVGIETYIMGICAVITEDTHFGVMLINAMMKIEPTSTLRVTVDEDEYFEFSFEAGATVIASTQLVKTDTIVYRIYDEIIAKGREPWYLDYTRMGKLFDTAKYHAGANVGSNQEVTQLIVSMVARNPNDRTKYYRQTVKTKADMLKTPPVFIPLRSVQFSATNTTNKLAGSYWNDALTSALVSPSTRTERIEELLRR